MASLLTFSFTLPLYAPKSSIQELRWSKAVVVRISSRFPGTRAKSLPAAGVCTLSRSSSVQQSINRSSTTHFENSGDLVSCLSVSSCTRRRITGYWVGPDTDDGWGFVEAFIYQIT